MMITLDRIEIEKAIRAYLQQEILQAESCEIRLVNYEDEDDDRLDCVFANVELTKKDFELK